MACPFTFSPSDVCFTCYVLAVYLWLSDYINKQQVKLTEQADRCGFAKCLKNMRKVWVEKYERHRPKYDRIIVSSLSSAGILLIIPFFNHYPADIH